MATASIIYLGPLAEVLSVDEHFEFFFGFPQKEVVGKFFFDTIIPHSQRSFYSTLLDSCVKNCVPSMMEILTSVVQVMDSCGELFTVQASVRHHNLHESALYIVELKKLEYNKCSITFDWFGRVIGRTCSDLFGYTDDELKSLKINDLLPELLPIHFSAVESPPPDYRYLLTDVTFSNGTCTYGIHKDGNRFGVEMQTKSFGAGLEAIFITTILKGSDSHIAVIRVDCNGNIKECSEEIREICGYEKEELLSQPIEMLFQCPLCAGTKKRKRDDWRRWCDEQCMVLKKDGSSVYPEYVILPVRKNGKENEEEYLIRFHLNKNTNVRVGPYFIEEIVAEGAYGVVKKAINSRTKESAAIKIVQKSKVGHEKLQAIREMKILRNLNHNNIVRQLDTYETEEKIYMVMEYIPGKTLKEALLTESVSMNRKKYLFRQLVSAIEYCHGINIFHRDIKPTNIIVTHEGQVKLIDFGLSNTSELDKLQSTFCGSPAYAAPEILLGHKYVGKAVDVWSLGVLLYALIALELPFQTVSDILHGALKFTESMDEDCRDLLKRMLQLDPKNRASITEVSNHRWLTTISPI